LKLRAQKERWSDVKSGQGCLGKKLNEYVSSNENGPAVYLGVSLAGLEDGAAVDEVGYSDVIYVAEHLGNQEDREEEIRDALDVMRSVVE
jgi:hypothetical protein